MCNTIKEKTRDQVIKHMNTTLFIFVLKVQPWSDYNAVV